MARLPHPFRKSKKSRPATFASDDFDWRTYNEHYRREIEELKETYSQHMAPGEYRFEDGRMEQTGSAKPLHPNHRLLYETLLQLQPASLVELGCGGGDHLRNLNQLLPDAQLFGFDRSEEQLAFLRERSPDLRAEVAPLDATLPYSERMPSVDLAYTQAVVMHIKTGNGHLVALSHLFRMASKQVVLMENWRSHDFVADVQMLHRERMLPWEQLHLYHRRSPEFGNRPHLLVASATPLDYEPLADDATLTRAQDETLNESR